MGVVATIGATATGVAGGAAASAEALHLWASSGKTYCRGLSHIPFPGRRRRDAHRNRRRKRKAMPSTEMMVGEELCMRQCGLRSADLDSDEEESKEAIVEERWLTAN